jgi:Na+-translocating ferredoxin:NAD+ oxidoreductase subunit B
MPHLSPEQVDELLPQTQCGLCGYGGCMPYAKALIAENAPINLCPPGGVKTLRALGELLQQDPSPYIPDMEQKAIPKQLAIIREALCIGCTKCIQACPVDAIIGTAKQMHTIITADCTGCELCIPPCPVDCIDIITVNRIEIEIEIETDTAEKTRANDSRNRFNARQLRLAREKANKKISQQDHSLTKKQHYVQEAIARSKAKKLGVNK